MTFVELLCIVVRDLDVEVDRGDLRLRVGNGGVDEMLQTLRSNASRAIRLRDGERWASTTRDCDVGVAYRKYCERHEV